VPTVIVYSSLALAVPLWRVCEQIQLLMRYGESAVLGLLSAFILLLAVSFYITPRYLYLLGGIIWSWELTVHGDLTVWWHDASKVAH
jgi:hypothetical protein